MTLAQPLPEFRLEVHFSRWEFLARHHLTASDAQTLSVGELLALAGPGAREQLDELGLGYSPTWGAESLREAIAATYERVEPDQVLAFAGAEEALFWGMQELVGPGEHAVVVVPTYQSAEAVTVATGADVSGLALDPAAGWRLDLAALEALLRPSTRLVAVNFPNNPTGAVPDRTTFTELAELCEERGIRLFSDEVYRGLELNEAKTLPQAADLSPTAVSLNVMSKAYGLPGLRIGWLACRDRVLLKRLERRKHYTSICNAGPSELLATLALRHGAEVRARNRGIIAANLPAFGAFFARHADRFDWEVPQGGCVCYPRYRGREGVEDFCQALVQEAGVLLLPASIYRSELAPVPTDRFRIGVGRRDPGPALDAIDTFLSSR